MMILGEGAPIEAQEALRGTDGIKRTFFGTFC